MPDYSLYPVALHVPFTKPIAAIFCLLLPVYSAFAGGPLIVQGSDGITPLTYENPNITLHTESGPLGALNNAQANALMMEAFSLWNNVSTSSINLDIDPTKINTDINLGNYDTYIPNADGTEFKADDGLNPVVYDSNGEIIDLLLGVGQSENTIGLGASVFTGRSNYFLEGYAILNGKDLGQTDTVIKLLIIHEIGHFFGLDHSQLNINNKESDSSFPGLCSTSSLEHYPVMYPFICRDTVSLHSDDISALSALYPSATIDNEFGILQGHFVDASGRGILGANLWFENTTTGKLYSIVSDYLKQRTGFFKIYLPAGEYTLHANSINPVFYGGSGIGPYANDPLDESFLSPHPIKEVTALDDRTGNPRLITVRTNRTVEFNFDLNGNQVDTSFLSVALENVDEGSGTAAPVTLLLLLSIVVSARRRISEPKKL